MTRAAFWIVVGVGTLAAVARGLLALFDRACDRYVARRVLP